MGLHACAHSQAFVLVENSQPPGFVERGTAIRAPLPTWRALPPSLPSARADLAAPQRCGTAGSECPAGGVSGRRRAQGGAQSRCAGVLWGALVLPRRSPVAEVNGTIANYLFSDLSWNQNQTQREGNPCHLRKFPKILRKTLKKNLSLKSFQVWVKIRVFPCMSSV